MRDRARAIRADWKYQSKRPSQAVLREQILGPLTELRDRLSDRLNRLERNDKLVPLDRDPDPRALHRPRAALLEEPERRSMIRRWRGMNGGLSLGNAGWLLPVLALWAAAVAAQRAGAPPAGPDGCAPPPALALRLGGFTVLALALLEPSWSRPRARPGANFFAVLADDSRSLQLPGAGGQPAGAALQRQLAGGQRLAHQLGRDLPAAPLPVRRSPASG